MKKIVIILSIILLLQIPIVFASNEYTTVIIDDLPSSFCWRDINGTDYSTRIKNQAPAPTCEAYALVAAIETLIQYQVGYSFDVDLSEAHLFFYPGGTCDWGVNVQDAANYLIEYGVPDEGCFPDPHRPYDTSFESVEGWEDRVVKVTEWGWVDLREDAIKSALIEYGPLVICMLNRADFLRYRGGIYRPHGEVTGGHVITIFGYDDDQQCWIIRNSAGESWGEDGWCRVAYDAHSPDHAFFWPFYGGTGIMYIDGVYGNFNPDVPKILIKEPEIFNTYIRGWKFPTRLRNIQFIQKGAPRIFGPLTVEVEASNTNFVEFYLDGKLQTVDSESPFEWDLVASRGYHIIETIAYNNATISKDIIDIHVLR